MTIRFCLENRQAISKIQQTLRTHDVTTHNCQIWFKFADDRQQPMTSYQARLYNGGGRSRRPSQNIALQSQNAPVLFDSLTLLQSSKTDKLHCNFTICGDSQQLSGSKGFVYSFNACSMTVLTRFCLSPDKGDPFTLSTIAIYLIICKSHKKPANNGGAKRNAAQLLENRCRNYACDWWWSW